MKVLTNKMLKKMYKRKTDNRMHSFGDTDIEKKVIRINKKKAKKKGTRGEILDSIVHEAYHAKHPKAHEKTTRKRTKHIIKHLSRRHKQKYYSLF